MPGGVLLASGAWFLWARSGSEVVVWLNGLEEMSAAHGVEGATFVAMLLAAAAVVAYLAAVLLGAVVGIAMGYIEYAALDRLAARALKIDSDHYFDEWDRYVDHLDDKRNSYISRTVESYMFGSRT